MRSCVCCEIRPVGAEEQRLCDFCTQRRSDNNSCVIKRVGFVRPQTCRDCARCGSYVEKLDDFGLTDYVVTEDGKLYCNPVCFDPRMQRKCHTSCGGCNYCIEDDPQTVIGGKM